MNMSCGTVLGLVGPVVADGIQYRHGSVVWCDHVSIYMGYAHYATLCPWYHGKGMPVPESSPVRDLTRIAI